MVAAVRTSNLTQRNILLYSTSVVSPAQWLRDLGAYCLLQLNRRNRGFESHAENEYMPVFSMISRVGSGFLTVLYPTQGVLPKYL